jgi:hypothetical protein
MRHRGEAGAAKSVINGVSGALTKLTDLLTDDEAVMGKHKLPAAQPLIPTQKVPTHEQIETAETDDAVEALGVVEVTDAPQPVVAPGNAPGNAPEAATDEITDAEPAAATSVVLGVTELAPQVTPVLPLRSMPTSIQWKASHGPRAFAAALLLLAVAGTSALGLRYAESRSSDEFISLVIGVGVVVGLWALLIASTPQVVSLRGSILTVRNSSGSERFDLADGLQPVDVLGEPRSSQWALLLHRSNNTSVVLRRRDVDAVALDPIVRHYRALASQRYADRQVRFSR